MSDESTDGQQQPKKKWYETAAAWAKATVPKVPLSVWINLAVFGLGVVVGGVLF